VVTYAEVAGLVAPGGMLYVVAAEPVPLRSEIHIHRRDVNGGNGGGDAAFTGAGPAGRLLAAVAEVRDAAVLLSGERPYREFPLSWYLDAVGALGWVVQVEFSRRIA
jgi:threonine dehydrogenase-like Zn-dependent dehydrogenase